LDQSNNLLFLFSTLKHNAILDLLGCLNPDLVLACVIVSAIVRVKLVRDGNFDEIDHWIEAVILIAFLVS
jgi:hypothetical protein